VTTDGFTDGLGRSAMGLAFLTIESSHGDGYRWPRREIISVKVALQNGSQDLASPCALIWMEFR